jgi:hypothetical protein
MKRLIVFVGLALFGVLGCSHKATPTAEVTPAPAADRSYINQAQAEIDSLQTKLDHLRDSTSWNKFRGNKETRRRLLNDTYARLGVAKQQIRDLQTATGADFDTRKAQLESTLASIRTTVNTTLAE